MKVYKKAQLLAFIVATEFGDRNPPFPLPDASVVPACVDNVLPSGSRRARGTFTGLTLTAVHPIVHNQIAMAVHFKLIDVSRSAYSVFSNGLGAPATSSAQKAAGLRLSHEEAYAVRAATLAACERVVSLTGEVADKTGKEWLRSMTEMNLYVRGLGADRIKSKSVARLTSSLDGPQRRLPVAESQRRGAQEPASAVRT